MMAEVPKVVPESTSPLEPPLKNIEFSEFAQKVEEKVAYRAILQSLSKPPTSPHIKKLIKSTINRLNDYKGDEGSMNNTRLLKSIS